jgi:hypothetical protein
LPVDASRDAALLNSWRASIMLGLHCGSILFDTTRGYESPPAAQLTTSEVCYRFFNSELYYNEHEIGTLLRTRDGSRKSNRAAVAVRRSGVRRS